MKNRTQSSQHKTKKWLNGIALCGLVTLSASLGGQRAQAQVLTDPPGQTEETSVWQCKAASGGCATFTVFCSARSTQASTGWFITESNIAYPQCGLGVGFTGPLCTNTVSYPCAKQRLYFVCTQGVPSALRATVILTANGCA